MKLKYFTPLATLKVGLARTWKCDWFHYISTEQDTTEFFDELLLAFVLNTANNSGDMLDVLMGKLNVHSRNRLLGLDIDQILRTIHDRPIIYSYSTDGDNIGFDDRSSFSHFNFVDDGNFEASKMLKFNPQIEYGDVSIGTISIVL